MKFYFSNFFSFNPELQCYRYFNLTPKITLSFTKEYKFINIRFEWFFWTFGCYKKK